MPSVTFLWNGAEWAEREAYDMFGIIFEGNRDLRRIYMPPDYLGFPLRKDFLLPDDASRSPGQGIRHDRAGRCQPARDAAAAGAAHEPRHGRRCSGPTASALAVAAGAAARDATAPPGGGA